MIDKNEFIEKIKCQFIDLEGVNTDENTKFRDLDDWDSLTGMAIQVMIKDDFGVDLNVDEFKSLITFGEIYSFVISNS